MGKYVSEDLQPNSFQVRGNSLTNEFLDSHSAIPLKSIIELKAEHIYRVGYDSYFGEIEEKEKDLMYENKFLFNRFKKYPQKVMTSLTSIAYPKFKESLMYSFV